jgi:hypothetical protein
MDLISDTKNKTLVSQLLIKIKEKNKIRLCLTNNESSGLVMQSIG